MWQVTVICPGARRCNVRATPNTVLLQILEQACSRQKLNPALYALKHHGKRLDLSLPLRFSGVPNNGKVELVEVEKPRSEDGEVVVAVQTADGTRVQSSFHSTTSLWDVLTRQKLDSSPDGMEPCLLYMRQEIGGEKALRSTQLRAIGLSFGRGVLRLNHRRAEQSAGERQSAGDRESVGSVDVGRQGLAEASSLEGGGKEAVAERSDEDEPRRKPPSTSAVIMDTTEREEEPPYFPAHPISYFSGPTECESINEDPHSGGSEGGQILAPSPPSMEPSPFSKIVSGLRPHPLAPHMSLPQPKVYDEPCDREKVVFSRDDPLPLPPPEETSDNFFAHTATDLHLMHSDLKRQAATSDAPLMTRAMRAVRDEMRLEKYKKSIVRVYFTDRWVLQGCFRPRESLKMLVNFVRENLVDPKVKFHLYTTPPKTVLRSGKVTLAEAGFLPAAVVYVGVANEDQPHPKLSDSALQQAVSSLQAEIMQHRHRVQPERQSLQATRVGPSNPPQSDTPPTAGASSGSEPPPSRSAGGGRGQQPKWFRPGPR